MAETTESAPVETAEEKPKRERRSKSDGRRRGGKDRPVIGLGDHVPAFLLREIKMPVAKRGKAEEPEADSDEGEDQAA